MNQGSTVVTGPPVPARRADAGTVRLGGRDVAVRRHVRRAPTTCWRRSWRCGRTGRAGSWPAGAAPGTRPRGRLGPGPASCWLTRSGLAVTGQR
jgi:hypothetical protein